MKKKICLLLFCLFALAVQANTGHLKFMGIPLDGTISQFQAKLIGKGAKLNRDYNNKHNKRLNGEACRYYTGNFAGYESSIKIKYNYKTIIVWGAMVLIEFFNKDSAESQLNYHKEKILEKYPKSSADNVVKNGIPSVRINVCDSNDFYGFVYLYTIMPPSSQGNKAYLVLNYKDYKNTEKNENNDLEDL